MATSQQVVVTTPPATSSPLVGDTSGASGSSAAFTPQLGRDMYLTLTGTWTGTIQIQRSTDGGTTWRNITIGGGSPWGRYTVNCDEIVDRPTDASGTYRITWSGATGSAHYRLAQ